VLTAQRNSSMLTLITKGESFFFLFLLLLFVYLVYSPTSVMLPGSVARLISERSKSLEIDNKCRSSICSNVNCLCYVTEFFYIYIFYNIFVSDKRHVYLISIVTVTKINSAFNLEINIF